MPLLTAVSARIFRYSPNATHPAVPHSRASSSWRTELVTAPEPVVSGTMPDQCIAAVDEHHAVLARLLVSVIWRMSPTSDPCATKARANWMACTSHAIGSKSVGRGRPDVPPLDWI